MNNKTFEENIRDIVHMSDKEALKKVKDGEYIEVLSHTPSVILDNVSDAKDIKIIIRFDAAYLATRHSGALEGNYHNFGEEFSNKLVSVLNNPNAIIRLKNGRLNLFGSIKTLKGNDSIVSVELNTVKDVNSKYQAYNLVVSMLPAKNNYINNLIIKQATKLEYEKEGLSQVNPQLHKSLSIINEKSSKLTISQTDTASQYYSIQESEKNYADLQTKYKNLNLNEDISELDGIPAIRLVDGSVLPLSEDENGRRMLHTEFIRKNKINHEDIESGGWIGKGVYEPSFTSDTQRYLEQTAAKKRVAELTGNEFKEFSISPENIRYNQEWYAPLATKNIRITQYKLPP